MNAPSLLIQFDDAWTPAVFINGQTNEETAKLQEIADKMIEAVKEGSADAKHH